jgi:hypothetical protein
MAAKASAHAPGTAYRIPSATSPMMSGGLGNCAMG